MMYTMLVGKPPFETSDVKTTYRRIRMNAYSFPDHIPLSPESKDLIERILISDPLARPSISQIEEHDFFMKNPIPKLLPTSTLAVPPSSSYLRQFDKINKPMAKCRESQSRIRLPRSSSQPSKEENKSSAKKEEGRASSGDRNENGSGSRVKKHATVSLYSHTVGGPKVWLKKWVDYSSKYGLGYLFSNGCAGVFFNDSSKITSDIEGNTFQYLTKSTGTADDQLMEYEFAQYPPELQKKVTLLQHFRKHLKTEEFVQENINPLPYVKKWIITSHAIIFRLSNKLVQVYFQDKSELMLCSDTKYVVYINKHGEITSTALINALDNGNKEMNKRLRYTKEIITTMLPHHGKVNSPRN